LRVFKSLDHPQNYYFCIELLQSKIQVKTKPALKELLKMKKFIVSTDSGCDFPGKLLAGRDIAVFPMKYSIDGVEFTDRMDPSEAPAFYDRMRAGAVPATSQITPMDFLDFWSGLLEKHNLPIVHISLGSAISGTYDNGLKALEMLKEKRTDARIFHIDSTLASLSYGMLALEAAEMRDAGRSAEECVAYIEELKPRISAFYTTDDLVYLQRSGRLSKASAVIGSALNINPLLYLDRDGHLLVKEKIRGRKKALKRIYELAHEWVIDPEEQELYICHSDCKPEEIQVFADTLMAENPFKTYHVYSIGPIIGSHTGPGLIAVFVVGKPRGD
jgi:DegV family protein with EDD domain